MGLAGFRVKLGRVSSSLRALDSYEASGITRQSYILNKQLEFFTLRNYPVFKRNIDRQVTRQNNGKWSEHVPV